MLNDTRKIAQSLVEGIVDEAMKNVIERKGSYCASLESVKLELAENEDVLTSSSPKVENVEKPKDLEHLSLNRTPLLDEGRYPDTQDVCTHSSVQSNTYKQGDGDYHSPIIRESTAFYCLSPETNECLHCNSPETNECLQCKSFSVSSLTSLNELITDMQNDIQNCSFDNIQLSDDDEDELQDRSGHVNGDILIEKNETVDFHQQQSVAQHQNEVQDSMGVLQLKNSKTFVNSKYLCNHSGIEEFILSYENDLHKKEVMETNNQNAFEGFQNNYLHQDLMHHSKKCCKLPNKRCFPLNLESSNDCLQSVCYGPDDWSRQEDDEVELINIQNETEQNVCLTNDYLNRSSPLSLVISMNGDLNIRDSAKGTVREINKEAESEHAKKVANWEEALEVQINVTEPGKSSDTDNEEEDNMNQTTQYLSNVGLMTHCNRNATYLGPSTVPGIESVKGMTRVQDQYFIRDSDGKICIAKLPSIENNSLQPSFELMAYENLHYLPFTKVNEEKKKKKKLISRLSTAISRIFRFKGKSSRTNL